MTESPFSYLKIRLFAGIGVDLVQTLDDPAGGPGKIGMFQPDEYGRKVEAGHVQPTHRERFQRPGGHFPLGEYGYGGHALSEQLVQQAGILRVQDHVGAYPLS